MSKQSAYVQYFVEGPDDRTLLNTLKTELRVIRPGRVDLLNAVQNELRLGHLRTLKPGTMVVLVFDIDAGSPEILMHNLNMLRSHRNVTEVVTIPQIKNLEDELKRACGIKDIRRLLGSQSKSDFKSDILRVTNLGAKLKQNNFSIDLFWSGTATSPYAEIKNQAYKVKLK